MQLRFSIAFDGAIDVSTVNSNTVFLVTLPGPGLLGLDFDNFTPRVIGINQIVWDPASLTLFAESNDHLNEDSNYLLVVTTGVHDAGGNPIALSSAFPHFVHADAAVNAKNPHDLPNPY